MTPDDIIRMARQAGIKLPDGAFPDQGSFTLPNLIQFAGLVAARTVSSIDPSQFMSYREGVEAGAIAEREACAKVCDSKGRQWRERSVPLLGYSGELEDCAASIRARGQT